MKIIVALMLLLLPALGSAQITIDDFTDVQAAGGEIAAPGAIGGARNLSLVGACTASIAGGVATITAPAASACELGYDGVVDGAWTAASSGGATGPFDLTQGGVLTELRVDATVTGADCIIGAGIVENGTGTFEFIERVAPNGSTQVSLPYTDLTNVDPANAAGLVLQVRPNSLTEATNCTLGVVTAEVSVTPAVESIVRVDPTPTNAASVQYTVTFNTDVSGVDATDFVLTTTGSLAGATVTGVSGSGSSYTVTVSSGSGTGTLRLDVVDNDSITAPYTMIPLGGSGAGNGDFSAGEVYAIDRDAPTASIDQAAGQADPASASPINFTVTFSEAVTGFDASDVVIGGTAGATTAVVTGGPSTFTIAVSGMTANGTVTVTIPAGAATDGVGNSSAAATLVDNVVAFGGISTANPQPQVIPASNTQLLALLAALTLLIGMVVHRRN